MMLLQAGKVRIYYDLLGEAGDPVVCLAHSLCADGGMWAEQVPALLRAGLRVLRVDMRGHGGTPATPGDYTMSLLAQDVLTVVEATVGMMPVDFVGLSIGGMIGLMLAIEHPQRIGKLVLCDTLAASPPAVQPLWDQRLGMVRAAGSVQPVADDNMRRFLSESFAKRNPVRWRQIREASANTSPDGYCGCAAAIRTFNVSSRLVRIRTPTLLICGAEDQSTPPAQMRDLERQITAARYEEIPRAHHFPNVECPELFNQHLIGWLRRRHRTDEHDIRN